MTEQEPRNARLRIVLTQDFAFGPGKADLLEGIRDTGSIAAAGRRMNMSYKRAWLLIDAMNQAFSEPVVETSKGGVSKGGARLTRTGEIALSCYRDMVAKAERAIESDLASMRLLVDGHAK